MLMLLSMHVTNVLFLVRFNNFALTMGFIRVARSYSSCPFLCALDLSNVAFLISLPCSGVAPPKTGLQWQQPFLELVLACMHAQSTTHEELLGPLKTQLSTFLVAFEKVAFTSIIQY